VRDSLSGESLIGATVQLSEPGAAVQSNLYGFYSLTIPSGKLTLVVSFAGYVPTVIEFELMRDSLIYVSLLQRSVLQEVVVSSKRKDGNVQNTQMGRIDLSMSQVKQVPVLLGEVDILKNLTIAPWSPKCWGRKYRDVCSWGWPRPKPDHAR
jgi:hypothetical protein